MTFEHHLPQARILELVQAFTALGVVYNDATRQTLMGGVPAGFVGLLQIGLPPKLQLTSDLNRMNDFDRFSDGTVPFVIWLRNVITLLAAGTPQEPIFQRALDDVQRGASGSPRIDTAALPERAEALVHEDDMVPFGFMSGGVAAARSVAKLMVPRFENGQQLGPEPVIYLGTGWMIGPELMITNHHVINARNDGEPAALPADFEKQALATTGLFDFNDANVAGVEFSALELLASDPTLDYALLRVPANDRTRLPLAKAAVTKAPNQSMPVNIIQHPGGQSKKFGIRNNLVSAATDTELRYFTDTLRGSSGSPVLDDKWTVVALHRAAAFAEGVKFNGRPTAWVNVGTQIHAVVSDIKARRPDLAAHF